MPFHQHSRTHVLAKRTRAGAKQANQQRNAVKRRQEQMLVYQIARTSCELEQRATFLLFLTIYIGHLIVLRTILSHIQCGEG